MVAKNTAETDGQIIDLTELIEKGEVPANELSEQAQPAAAPEVEPDQEALNEHLRSLNDGSSAADAEIDDLLAQMDLKDDGQSEPNDVALDFSAPSTQTDHPIDPNEQLHMPGMGDVDSLLDSLDIPPQPTEREPEAEAPVSADQAVDALLNDFNTAPPAEQPAAAPKNSIPDLDELLASVSAAPAAGNSSAIDDLLSAGNAVAAAPAAPAAQGPAFFNDDLDSLLAAAASDLDAAPSPAQPQTAPAPQAAAPTPAPASTMASTMTPTPAPAPAAAPDMGIDIDSLLAAAADDLQSALDAAQPQTAPAPQPAPASEPQPDLNADLDGLLAAVTDGATPTPETQGGVSDVLLHPELELMADAQPDASADTQADAGPEPVSDVLTDALPEMEPALESAQEPQPKHAVELPADFDALLAATREEAATGHASVAPADAPPTDVQEFVADASAQAESDVFETVAESEPAQANDLPLLEPDEILPPDAGVQPESSGIESLGTESSAAEPAGAEPVEAHMPEGVEQPSYEPAAEHQAAPVAEATGAAEAGAATAVAAVSATALEAVMDQAKEASSHAIDAFAQAFDATTRAADAAETANKLAARVEQCEHALHEAGERIIALETALEAQIHAAQELAASSLPRQELEDMFVEGHPLHQSLMDCIGKAVAAALASAPAPQAGTADAQSLVEEGLQPVVTAARSATARIDALESRLDALEPRFNDRVERAAAAAAARILREEIGRLLEE